MEKILILFSIGFAFVLPFFVIALVVFRNRSATRLENHPARFDDLQGFRAGRARLVRAECEEIQRRAETTSFKVLLEVFPADAAPAFTVAVMWDLAPRAMPALVPGEFLDVRIDPANQRRVFPDFKGAYFCHDYHNAWLHVPEDYAAEEAAAAEGLAAPAQKPQTIYRKRSARRLFGLPLWEVAFNVANKKGNMRYLRQAKARAIVAVGDHATGVIAIGGFAKGLVAVGQFSLGLVSFGLFSVGLLAFGAFGVGLAGFGVMAAGLLGVAAFFSGGYFSISMMPLGKYVLGKDDRSPEMMQFYEMFKELTGLGDKAIVDFLFYPFMGTIVLCFGFFLGSMFAQLVLIKMLEGNDDRVESPRD